ncbi:hypothetical protein MUN89_21735 [Halobacillus salinarum]|uniref:Uncharacterized protein n=1 Tax=Halobacillus salinarum TaxID=2932257 RepID=A0ABY4EQN4_9BACI|nr:hypothetical protein [Halobacillus salinarum]UOQ44411.1 hypothetical protein MUN89_21735 [Halobacillus salinarum]
MKIFFWSILMGGVTFAVCLLASGLNFNTYSVSGGLVIAFLVFELTFHYFFSKQRKKHN